MARTTATVHTETVATAMNGYVAVALVIADLLAALALYRRGFEGTTLFICLLAVAFCFGFFTLQPNKARVLILFGKYRGTVRAAGLWWANPLYLRGATLSLRLQTLDSSQLKVNDKRGNILRSLRSSSGTSKTRPKSSSMSDRLRSTSRSRPRLSFVT